MSYVKALVCLVIFLSPYACASEIIKILYHHPSRYNLYSVQVLKQTLSYHKDKYSIEYAPEKGELARELRLLEKGVVSVTWVGTSKNIEERFIPIRVPIFKGLLAYRILLIQPQMQRLFSQVKTLEDLKRFKVGQGAHWPDTKIYRENGFKVVTSAIHFSLFDMLAKGRFDAFPRGVTEPWSELKINKGKGLAVEQSILIAYTLPVYFFVAKGREALAQDIEFGMNQAVDDGSLQKLLFDDPDLIAGIRKAKLAQRKIFHLKNNSLPLATPLETKKYWLTLNALAEIAEKPAHQKNSP